MEVGSFQAFSPQENPQKVRCQGELRRGELACCMERRHGMDRSKSVDWRGVWCGQILAHGLEKRHGVDRSKSVAWRGVQCGQSSVHGG